MKRIGVPGDDRLKALFDKMAPARLRQGQSLAAVENGQRGGGTKPFASKHDPPTERVAMPASSCLRSEGRRLLLHETTGLRVRGRRDGNENDLPGIAKEATVQEALPIEGSTTTNRYRPMRIKVIRKC